MVSSVDKLVCHVPRLGEVLKNARNEVTLERAKSLIEDAGRSRRKVGGQCPSWVVCHERRVSICGAQLYER
jgi:hypothetical protein